jgi:hypothetical protein
MNTLFRGEAKIIDIPKESGVENINLYEIYWGFLGKESFDNEELKKYDLKLMRITTNAVRLLRQS